MKRAKVVVLGGDGVGPEVTAAACAVIEPVARQVGLELLFEEHPIGCAAIDAHGDPLPRAVREAALEADAVLLGAVGSRPDLPAGVRRAEEALLELRAALGVWSNLRPVRSWSSLEASVPLKTEVARGVDLLVVRELAGGLYYGEPQGLWSEDEGMRAVDTLVYTSPEIERIARQGFEQARQRRGRLASVDKANVLATSRLWRHVVEEVATGFPDVQVEHVLVDACAMRLVADPRSFDVILTENTFGDILSDGAAPIAGSLGMLPSASLGGRVALYEPVHGTAPDLAGQDRANPVGAILSGALMLRHTFGEYAAAQSIEDAIEEVLEAGARTADIAAVGELVLGTRAFAQQVRDTLEGRAIAWP